MSVPANMRNLSTMEYYKAAVNIRQEITQWLMRDFGNKKNPRNIKQVIKDITDDDASTINKIFEKYGKSINKEFIYDYPQWFVEAERKIIIKILQQMVSSIVEANSIYPVISAEWDLRRCKQDEAIMEIHKLHYELQYIQKVFPQNLNYFIPLLESLDREEHLIKGWRQSDGKRRKECIIKERGIKAAVC